jgi:energy-converting hydrogenase Eha subunit E
MFQPIDFWTAVIVFFGYLIIDILSSWFIIALNKLQRGTTTIQTFCLHMGSGLIIFQYTHNLSYLVFAALGAFLGNYILLTIAIRKSAKDKK